jgi:ABC-type phosphate/phosphonate transport system substrate-binding protein
MIASLPMYARMSNRAAHDALWGLIRDGLRARDIAAPDALDHDTDHMAGWARPDLVLGQICNLPLRARFANKVTVIGTADYGLADCPSGHYRSAFVTHKDNPAQSPAELASARFVCNDLLSQSGYASAQFWARGHGFQFSVSALTGSHRASIAAVANGSAGIAAIDAHSWRIECGENPLTGALKVIGYTDTSPGMTFITRAGQNRATYFAAISQAISDLPAAHAQVLGLRAIVDLPESDYDLPIPSEVSAIPA